MKGIKYYLLICCLAVTSWVNAQEITSVSGTVSDSFGPIVGAAVVEVDASNRNVSATVTDFNGNFTLKIKSSKNKLKFSYVGLKEQIHPINKRVYNLTLEDAMVMKELVVEQKKYVKTSGLAIPEREVSFASQTIDAKEFEGLGVTSIDEALQGRIAGLDIVANSGNLGAGTSMRLRGTSTISSHVSTEPIIVVNGDRLANFDPQDIDFNNANDEQFAQLLNVNPDDIEKITVLKDAAATAIWGSEGANGVIEITTKRGKRGKPRLSYRFTLSATHQPEAIKRLTGDQYTMYLKEAFFNPRQSDESANIDEINYNPEFSEYQMFNESNTDWISMVKQVGFRQNHTLSVSGGDEKASFRISAGYDHETGSIIEQRLDRFTARMALDYYVSDRITVITDFDMVYTDNHRNADGLLNIAYRKMPNLSVYEQDEQGRSLGRYYHMLKYTAGGSDPLSSQRGLVNPLASAEYAKSRQKTYSINPKLELKYDLLGVDDFKHRLTYNGKVLVNVSNNFNDSYYPRSLSTADWNAGVSRGSTSADNRLSFTTTHTLTFMPHFNNEDHSFMTMGRFQLVSGTSANQSTNVSGLPNGIESPSAGGLNPGMGSGFSRWRSLFYTFSAHYAYKGRYVLDFSARVDGTTKFGPSKRWGVFPAVSGRWNIIDEKFMEPTRKWLSMLCIRPSWGLTGASPGADFLYVNQYVSSGNYLGFPAMAPNNMKMTEMRYEFKNSYNLGFDLGFFDNKLTMDINLYDQTTTDMLLSNKGIPGSTGYKTYPIYNYGDMNNRGWELNISGREVVKKGKFSMDVNLTFADNQNLLKKMDPTILKTYNKEWQPQNAYLLQRVQINNPFGAIYGYRSKGVYTHNYDTFCRLYESNDPEDKALLEKFTQYGGKGQYTAPVMYDAKGNVVTDMKGEPLQMNFDYDNESTTLAYGFKGGDAIYEDVNHDGNINELDVVYLGTSLPKLNGGFGFRFHYDRWALNAQFNYRIDYDVVNMNRLNMESMSSTDNQSQAVNYRWRKEGDYTSIPRAMINSEGMPNYNTMISDRFVEDASFLRLNYVQLSYSLPTKHLKKIGLSQLSFYCSANNLFVLTRYSGVDPEIGYGGYSVSTDNSQTPRPKSYTLGLTIGF